MDGDLGPISPICRSGAPAFFMPLALDVLEAGVLGVMPCAVAAKEAVRASVAAILTMDEGALHTAAR